MAITLQDFSPFWGTEIIRPATSTVRSSLVSCLPGEMRHGVQFWHSQSVPPYHIPRNTLNKPSKRTKAHRGPALGGHLGWPQGSMSSGSATILWGGVAEWPL